MTGSVLYFNFASKKTVEAALKPPAINFLYSLKFFYPLISILRFYYSAKLFPGITDNYE